MFDSSCSEVSKGTSVMFESIKYGALFVISILSCLFLGKVTYGMIGGLPASLYGMLFFTLVLRLGLVDPVKIDAWVKSSISYMPIVFLPVCIGVVQYWSLIQRSGLVIFTAAILATLTTLTVVGILAQRMGRGD